MLMRTWIHRIFLLITVMLMGAAAHAALPAPTRLPADSIIIVSRGVIQRLIGNLANGIQLRVISPVGNNDAYEISAHNGQLLVMGSSPSAICHGFYKYLQNACHSMVSWSGAHLPLPAAWPDYPEERVVSPYQYRYFLNVVTFGYTTPYWDWARWEKELDWMALHGINLVLAPVASESIAARVWRQMGVQEKDIKDFFTGPAYFPWHRMGNLNKWDGPFPDTWQQDQLNLQHHIINRMRQLGIAPIAPAFAGFVPEGFQKLHPELPVKKLEWGGFPEGYNAYVLSPNTPFFEKIGRLFVQEWEKEFGKNIFYLSDSFNEMDVPGPKDDPEQKYRLLADYGKTIYRSVVAGNPDAVWVTQGWTFGYQHVFWDQRSLKAMLSGVPDDHMMIVDLGNEYPPYVWKIPSLWKTHQGFYGKPWIYSYVPNFGGKTPYTGVLDLYASGSAEALQSPYRHTLAGFGAAPEGLENNEVIYELLAHMAWTEQSIDLTSWLPAYCRSRYGACPPEMDTAWQQLRRSCYSTFSPYPRFVWQLVTPDHRRVGKVDDQPAFFTAVQHFLHCAPQLQQSNLYRNDALELAALYLGLKADRYYKAALLADSLGQTTQCRTSLDTTIQLLLATDSLLASHPTDRLTPWVAYARAHGQNEADKDYYEADAKRLITTWGGRQEDYAARMWSGLIRDYYVPRLRMYFSDKRAALPDWEQQWIKRPGISALTPYADPVGRARKLVDAFSER